MKRLLQWCLLLLLFVLAESCKEKLPEPDPNPDPNTGENPGDGPEISDEKRIELLDLIKAKSSNLSWENPKTAYDQLIEFLKTIPEVKAAGFSQAGFNVWAEFTDGQRLMVLRNTLPDPKPTTEHSPSGRRAATQASARMAVPGSSQVVLMNGMGPLFRHGENSLKTLDEMFREKGYTTTQLPASVENLKQVKEAGVFYLNTHGGYTDTTKKTYSLWTTDEVSAANNKKFKDDLKKGNLVYIISTNALDSYGKLVDENHYGITVKFVKQYMSFSENALLYLNACSSFMDEDLKYALLGKTNHTGTYIGWTNPFSEVVGYPTLKYVFDRLLGDNHRYVEKQENPKQRSFDFKRIFEEMLKEDLGIGQHPEYGTAYLTYQGSQEHNALLRPTIEYMGVDELNDLLYLRGSFGEDPGQGNKQITINTIPVEEIGFWSETLIMCKIKRTGAGSSGDVVVSAFGHKSHPRQLTEWRGRIKFNAPSEGSMKETITYDIHLRGDVGIFRRKPGETPKLFSQAEKMPVSNYIGKDSKASYYKGGEASHQFTHGCTHYLTAAWTTLEGEVGIFDPIANPNQQDFFVPQTEFTQQGIKLSHLDITLSKTTEIKQTSRYVCPDGSGTNPVAPQKRSFNGLPQKFKNITLRFDSQFNIVAGKLEEKQGSHSELIHGGEAIGDPIPEFTWTLEWNRISATHPPKADGAF